jgi:hypothetical protein
MHIQAEEGLMVIPHGCRSHTHIHFQASALPQQDHLQRMTKNKGIGEMCIILVKLIPPAMIKKDTSLHTQYI